MTVPTRPSARTPIATEIPAIAPVLRPLSSSFEVDCADPFDDCAEFDPVVVAALASPDVAGLKSWPDGAFVGGLTLVAVVTWSEEAVALALVVEDTASDDADAPVITDHSSGEAAENVSSVTVPLHPPSPQHIQTWAESSYWTYVVMYPPVRMAQSTQCPKSARSLTSAFQVHYSPQSFLHTASL